MRVHLRSCCHKVLSMRLLSNCEISQAAGIDLDPLRSIEGNARSAQDRALILHQEKALSWAVQLAVVIGDVTPATLETIEVCITIMSITCPATCD